MHTVLYITTYIDSFNFILGNFFFLIPFHWQRRYFRNKEKCYFSKGMVTAF